MSLLTTVEAVPSRVLACIRAHLLFPVNPPSDEELLQIVWPTSLRSGTGKMGESVLRAVRISGLLDREVLIRFDDSLNLQKLLLLETVCGESSGSLDLAKAMAFFLRQGPNPDWGTYDWFRSQVDRASLGEEVNVRSKEVFDVMEDWLLFFGFARLDPPRGPQRRQLVPDPTRYLSLVLDDVVPITNDPLSIKVFMESLIKKCPVLPGGKISTIVSGTVEHLPDRHLNWSISTALMRLNEEGKIDLKYMPDGLPYLFTSEHDDNQFTHIKRGS
jgi:hypothetical protein